MKKALELGCGDLTEANSLREYLIIAVDKKITETPAPHVTCIEADYFNMELHETFDLIYAHYTLCFNTRKRIESGLPQILSHLVAGGVLIIKDFSKDETTVTKRTNMDDEWFFELIRTHVGSLSLTREKIFEWKHQHTHNILTIQSTKTISEEQSKCCQ